MRIRKRTTVRKPCEAFKKCPDCGCTELIVVLDDVLCSSCSWDSIIAYADARFDQQIGFLFRPQDQDAPAEETNTNPMPDSPCVVVVA